MPLRTKALNRCGNKGRALFADCNPEEPSTVMQNVEMAEQLWGVSEELVRDYLA